MDYDYKIAVIIAAAGKGERIGKAVPKQFLPLKPSYKVLPIRNFLKDKFVARQYIAVLF